MKGLYIIQMTILDFDLNFDVNSQTRKNRDRDKINLTSRAFIEDKWLMCELLR